jgi:hypothetical protein
MTRAEKRKRTAKSKPEFPALRDFFSGYLHQDFQDEYGSAADAAKAFCADASDEEIATVRKEWKTWRSHLGNAPIERAASSLRSLGAAWQPQAREDLDSVETALKG